LESDGYVLLSGQDIETLAVRVMDIENKGFADFPILQARAGPISILEGWME
jgi:hypothetical protein